MAGALVLAPSWARAQTLTGSISGAVRDSQGAPLPGATLSLLGDTGTATTVTDAEGRYRFPLVAPGAYRVLAEMPRFKSVRQERLAISIGRRLEVDFSLDLAPLTENLDVRPESAVVDVSASASPQSVSQDLLFNMPLGRQLSAELMNNAPAVNDQSAFGGPQRGNGVYLDGVSIRTVGGGSADFVVLSYNSLEEVQVQGLGAPAEYGAFRGAVVNFVSRSGGNRLTGLADVQYTSLGLASENTSPALVAQNPFLARPSGTRKLLDLNAQLAGPLVKDRLFFLVNAERYEIHRVVPGPVATSEEVSPRLFSKLTWKPGQKDTLNGILQWRNTDTTGLSGFAPEVATALDLSENEHTQDRVWSLQWQRIIGPRTFLEARYHGYSSRNELQPLRSAPVRYDLVTGAYSGGGGVLFRNDRGRQSLNVAITHHADDFLNAGAHDFKFGLELGSGHDHPVSAYSGGLVYYDYGGQLYQATSYSSDLAQSNRRASVYVQDTWKAGSHLTLTPGLRFDWMRGGAQDPSTTLYRASPISPRLGVAFDPKADNRTVLRAFYGQYYEEVLGSYYYELVPGRSDYVTYDVTGGSPVEIDRFPLVAAGYRMDPSIRHPKVVEWSLGLERALAGATRVSAIAVLRTDENYIASLLPSARWTPTEVPNALTGGTLTVYNWANRSASEDDRIKTNPEGFVYRDAQGNPLGTARAGARYRALILTLERPFRRGWQAKVSYVLSRNSGTVDPFFQAASGRESPIFNTPTFALVNLDGEFTPSRRHELKAFASYVIPRVGVALNAYYRLISGRTYAYTQLYSSRQVNYSFGREPFLEPRGSRRYDSQNQLDLRLEKVFRKGNGRIGGYVDVTNVFNAAAVTGVVTRVPKQTVESVDLPYGTPTVLASPRQVILGARWSF